MSDMPADLTVQLLRQIRDELKAQRSESNARSRKTEERFEKMDQRFEKIDQRFEIIESTLLGTNEHLAMMSRSLRALLDRRNAVDARLDDHEERLSKLEKRKAH